MADKNVAVNTSDGDGREIGVEKEVKRVEGTSAPESGAVTEFEISETAEAVSSEGKLSEPCTPASPPSTKSPETSTSEKSKKSRSWKTIFSPRKTQKARQHSSTEASEATEGNTVEADQVAVNIPGDDWTEIAVEKVKHLEEPSTSESTADTDFGTGETGQAASSEGKLSDSCTSASPSSSKSPETKSSKKSWKNPFSPRKTRKAQKHSSTEASEVTKANTVEAEQVAVNIPGDDETEIAVEKVKHLEKPSTSESTADTDFGTGETGQAASSEGKLSESCTSASPSSSKSPENKSSKKSWKNPFSPRKTRKEQKHSSTEALLAASASEVTEANPDEAEQTAFAKKSVESPQMSSMPEASPKIKSTSPSSSKSPETKSSGKTKKLKSWLMMTTSPIKTGTNPEKAEQPATLAEKFVESHGKTSEALGIETTKSSTSPSSSKSPETSSSGKTKSRSWLNPFSPRKTSKAQQLSTETSAITGTNPDETQQKAMSDMSVEPSRKPCDTSGTGKTESLASSSPIGSAEVKSEDAKEPELIFTKHSQQKTGKEIEHYGAESGKACEEETKQTPEETSESTDKTSDASGIAKTESTDAFALPSSRKSVHGEFLGASESVNIPSQRSIEEICDNITRKLTMFIRLDELLSRISTSDAIPENPLAATESSRRENRDERRDSLAEHLAAISLQDAELPAPRSEAMRSGQIGSITPYVRVGMPVQSRPSISTDEGRGVAEIGSTTSSSACDVDSTHLESQDVSVPDKVGKKLTCSETDAERSLVPSLAECDEPETAEATVGRGESTSPRTRPRLGKQRATEVGNIDAEGVKGTRGCSGSPRSSELHRQTGVDTSDDDPLAAESSPAIGIVYVRMKETGDRAPPSSPSPYDLHLQVRGETGDDDAKGSTASSSPRKSELERQISDIKAAEASSDALSRSHTPPLPSESSPGHRSSSEQGEIESAQRTESSPRK